ncbi:MAG TPA: LLM class flavin-dependent oxidoreductase [Novosphingobium sp.]|nr:LLM class flavin-dependent oxidoreductase [Novosphingobium sp.]
MPFEAIGILHWNDYSETRPKPFDVVEPDFIARCAQVHEEAGFDRLLIANSAHRPDSLPLATWAAAATTRIKFMLAHRPGFIAPTMAARMFAMLDRMSAGPDGQGRAGVHIITGGDDAEMEADGDFLTKDVRYRRSAEYVDVMRRVWQSDAPFDHEGEFYRARGAFAHVRPGGGAVPIFWGGSSEWAIAQGAKVADVFAFPGFAPEVVQPLAADVLARAATHGRRPDLLVSVKVLVGASKADAWDRARGLLEELSAEVVDNGRAPTLPGESRAAAIARVLAQAEQDSFDGRMWTGISRVPTGRATIPCVIGSVDEVMDTLMAYHACGITRFILSGYEPEADARMIGRLLIPRLREGVEGMAQQVF